MISIITGDIINSRNNSETGKWLSALKETLAFYGESPKDWDIYRGDSFQVEISKPDTAFLAAIRLKATIKAFKDLDVRMAIGIGEISFRASRITESNGPAFVNSGDLLEQLKKNKETLAIRSPWPKLDEEINLIIKLSCIAMDKWTSPSAEFVKLALELQDFSQKDLIEKLKIGQSAVSERQSRAYFSEIVEAEAFIREKLIQKTNPI